jgi:2-C-methyl-D-erythritol 2,4-cyclodiphosphate synthase
MKQNIARHAFCEEQLVNVKATTTEWLGFEGEERGISSQAVVLLVDKNKR